MSVPEIVGLLLYALQQLGVALGVGAETVALFSASNPANPALAGVARKTTRWALGAIIFSGILITLAHIIAGEGATVAEPAYLLKWLLILIILAAGFMRRGSTGTVIVGGSWYALFFLHTLAPVAPWFGLLIFYIGWMALFALVFLFLQSRAEGPEAPPAPASVPVPEQQAPPPKPHPVSASPPPPPPAPAFARPMHTPAFVPPTPAPAFAPASPSPDLSWKSAPRVEKPLPSPAALPRFARPPAPPPSAPPNLPGLPEHGRSQSGAPAEHALAPTALQSIPTAVPANDAKPLSGIRVMPRSPDDLKNHK